VLTGEKDFPASKQFTYLIGISFKKQKCISDSLIREHQRFLKVLLKNS